MNTWLRSLLAVVTVSLPLAGCAAQTADGTDTQSLAPVVAAATPIVGKGALASVDAKFSQWLVSPSGKVTGLLLDDGSVAMVPHHAAKDVTKATLQPGDAVHVEGFSHQGSPVYAFASVKKGDTTIVDAPRPPQGELGAGAKGTWRKHDLDPQKVAEWRAQHPDFVPGQGRAMHEGRDGEERHEGKWHHEDTSSLAPASATGTVVALLPGRHGETRAVVLSDGTVAYAKHSKTDAKLGDLVKKGDTISVSGKGGSYELGKALVIESVKLPSGETKEI